MRIEKGWNVVPHLTMIEIVPDRDLMVHLLGDECWCNPTVERINNIHTMVAHNSADKRELLENAPSAPQKPSQSEH